MQARRERKWGMGIIILDKMTRKGLTKTAVPQQRPEEREERETSEYPGKVPGRRPSRASTLRQEPVPGGGGTADRLVGLELEEVRAEL